MSMLPSRAGDASYERYGLRSDGDRGYRTRVRRAAARGRVRRGGRAHHRGRRRPAQDRSARRRATPTSRTSPPSGSRAVLADDHGRLALRAAGAGRRRVICVPTPLTPNREPDLGALTSAGRVARPGRPARPAVVLESTTYPGTTREHLVPILEAESGLRVGSDLNVAFSPERVDPGRTDFTLRNTPKVSAGSRPRAPNGPPGCTAASATRSCASPRPRPPR